MQNDYLIQSQIWQDEADSLLTESKLIGVLQQFGNPEFTGSYKYRLMLDGDIDLYLITPNATKETAHKLIDASIEQGFWNGYMLYDWINFRRDYFPEAYYVGMQTDFRDHRWKVDIWILPEFSAAHREYNNWLESNLDNNTREIIFMLKSAKKDRGWNVDGKTIYDAVLKEGIVTIEDFENKIIKAKGDVSLFL